MRKKVIKKNFVIVIIILLFSPSFILFFSTNISAVTNVEWWNENWQYRVKIPINPSSAGVQYNYQKMLMIHNGSGTNICGNIYCNQHCRNDFGDLRFIDSRGIEVDYWIEEKIDGDYTKVWVKLPIISPIKTLDYFIYYGNHYATSLSNGESTFLLFDDFDDEIINSALWTVFKKGSSNAVVEEINGELCLAGKPNVVSSGNLKSKIFFRNNFSIEFLRKADQEHFRDISIGNGPIVDAYSKGSNRWMHTTFKNGYIVLIQNDNLEYLVNMNNGIPNLLSITNNPPEHGSYRRNIITYLENGSLEHWIDGDKIIESIDITYKTTKKYILLTQGEDSTGKGDNSYFNWLFVRKYNSLDPTWSIPGNEQKYGVNNPPITISERPVNNSKHVSVYLSEISFKLTDLDDDNLTYTVIANPDFIGGPQSGTITSGTTINLPRRNGILANDTMYVWWVNVTDGKAWTNNTYVFTTVNEIFSGYTLFSPMIQDEDCSTYLIDNNGDIVHTWFTNNSPSNSPYMIENGSIIRPYMIFNGNLPQLTRGIQKINWDGTIFWDFQYSGEDYWQHHDIEPLPNGNVLILANEIKTRDEAIAAGRNPDLFPHNELWSIHIVEVKPTGPISGEIIWEWHLWDHLIQDFDPTKDNYGTIEEHPELLDINFPNNSGVDWIHVNSVKYNSDLDQIMISSRNLCELWIIDHSTTTEESSGHTGGIHGKGGDFLYRWGNPQSYRAGNKSDKKLFCQHDAQWIKTGCPGEGNILVFNNGVRRPGGRYSSIDEITPPLDANNNYTLIPGDAYGPENLTWQYIAEDPFSFFAIYISGCERLPNGNTLICDGPSGFFFEVTMDGEIVWTYLNIDPYPGFRVFKVRRYYSPFCPPVLQNISGPTAGTVGEEYSYNFTATDPDDNDVYYYIDWGDDNYEEWIGPFNSGEEITVSHSWDAQNNYTINCRAKDPYDSMSNWSSLIVNINP